MGKWAVPNSGEFFCHVAVVGLESELASITCLLPNCSADVVLSRTDEEAGAKKSKTRIQRSDFRLGVRGSSLDSRALSIIPLNYTPLVA